MKDIASTLKAHRQLHNWSCSASAHEFVAKLHDKLIETDFPLQDDPASEKGGFQFEPFLNGIGFTGQDTHLSPDDALDLLAREIKEGKFPLVSLLGGMETDKAYWHIVVAVANGDEVAFVDPAKQDFTTNSSAESLALLRSVVAAIPGRDKINILSYRDK